MTMNTNELLKCLRKEFVREGVILHAKLFAVSIVAFATKPVMNKFEANRQKKLQMVQKRKRQSASLAEFCNAVMQLNEKSHCIDLGANVGKISEIFASTGASVLSYEPDPWSYQQLKNRLSMFTNVYLNEAAVGTENGHAYLNRAANFDDNQKNFSLGSSLVRKQEGGTIKVELRDIRTIIRSINGTVDILKIDIEGAEIALLKALIDDEEALRKIGKAFVETHETFGDEFRRETNELRDELKRRGLSNINLDWV